MSLWPGVDGAGVVPPSLGGSGATAIVPRWWDPNSEGLPIVAAYQARGIVSYLASLVNLANPGVFDLVEGNGPVTWDIVNGWQFTGGPANKYFDTTITVGTNWTALVQYAGAIAGTAFGYFQAVNRRFTIFPIFGGAVAYGNGGFGVVVPPLPAGNLAFADRQAYRNGAAEGAPIGGWAAPATFSYYVGCRRRADIAGIDLYFTGDVYAHAIYNAALTGPQVLAIVTAMAAL